eukprot:scaffold13643_cov110-Isochrysis_galbana.AAC.9
MYARGMGRGACINTRGWASAATRGEAVCHYCRIRTEIRSVVVPALDTGGGITAAVLGDRVVGTWSVSSLRSMVTASPESPERSLAQRDGVIEPGTRCKWRAEGGGSRERRVGQVRPSPNGRGTRHRRMGGAVTRLKRKSEEGELSRAFACMLGVPGTCSCNPPPSITNPSAHPGRPHPSASNSLTASSDSL